MYCEVTGHACLYLSTCRSLIVDALSLLDKDETTETRTFIRMMDTFFNCLNVCNTVNAKTKRKENLQPYRSPNDVRFKVSNYYLHNFLIVLNS